MKVFTCLKYFWLSLLLLFLTGVNLFFVGIIRQRIIQIRQLNLELQQEIRKDNLSLHTLEKFKKQREFYEKILLKRRIYSFNSDMEAEAFLLDYFTRQIKRYKGRLRTCQIHPFPSSFSKNSTSPTALQLKTIKLQATFTNYINLLHLLQSLEETPPLFIVKKLAISKDGMRMSVAIECEFAYDIKHES